MKKERVAERCVEAEGLTVADGNIRAHRARRGQDGAGELLLAGNHPSSGATRHLPPKG